MFRFKITEKVLDFVFLSKIFYQIEFSKKIKDSNKKYNPNIFVFELKIDVSEYLCKHVAYKFPWKSNFENSYNL